MPVNKSDYEYCIEVERGKYHVVLTKDYHVKYLRHGEEWINNPPGSKMMIALMDRVERMEKALEFYADECNHKPHKREAGAFHSKVTEDAGQTAREALK